MPFEKFRKERQCYRYSLGKDLPDGSWLDGLKIPFSIISSLQPSTPDELLTLREGLRSRESYTLFYQSNDPLRTVETSISRKPDIVTIDNEEYECISTYKWKNDIISHYRSIVQKLTRSEPVEGETPMIPRDVSNVILVAKSGGDYDSIQDAINSVNDAASNNRYVIFLMPGLYQEQITMKSWVDLVGLSKHSSRVKFTGNNNGTIILADWCQVQDILIEETEVESEWGIIGNNVSNWHVRNVDILAPSGNPVSQGIKIIGDSWETGFLERSVIDYKGVSGWAVHLEGNETTPQNCDLTINDCFIDSLYSTSGGSINYKNLFAGTISKTRLRTSSNGICLKVDDTLSNNTDIVSEYTSGQSIGGSKALRIESGATLFGKYNAFDTVSNSGTYTILKGH